MLMTDNEIHLFNFFALAQPIIYFTGQGHLVLGVIISLSYLTI